MEHRVESDSPDRIEPEQTGTVTNVRDEAGSAAARQRLPIKPSPAMAIFWATLAACLLHLVWYYPRLPETVAAHYDALGQPDGWTSKGTYAAVLAVMYVLVAGLFLAVWTTMRRFPAHLISVPNREYWMMPNREAYTRTALARNMLWLGWAALMLLLVITDLTFRANLREDASLGLTPWIVIGVYVAFCAGLVVRLIYRFYTRRV